jgi:hypothetical protein
MHLILHVRRVGCYRERELLGGFVPLLLLLIVHATLEVLVTFFGESRERQR